jgi:hypothetical protein
MSKWLKRGEREEGFGENYHDDSDGSGDFRAVFHTSAVQDYARYRRSVAHAKEDLKGREKSTSVVTLSSSSLV